MPCYCRKIRRCKRDINKIEEVQRILYNISARNTNEIASHERNVSSRSYDSFKPNNISDLQNAIKRFNDDFASGIEDMREYVIREIHHLYSELDYMEDREERYHDDD